MIGTTLNEIRDHIELLASDDGDYYLVCGRYGDRPVPAARLRFETRATARAAARATEQYRRALRRYDPQVPTYDIIACQDTEPGASEVPVGACCDSKSDSREWSLSAPVVNRSPTVDREFVEFCHRVAAAVFETLSAHGYDAVESAIMDAYFALAEELSDPDGLCLRLLESMSVELAASLESSEQVTLLSAAAARLEYAPEGAADTPTHATDEWTVDETASTLRDVGLFRSCTRIPDARAADEPTLTLDMSGYTLRPHRGRLPLLPVAIAFHRCRDAWVPTETDAFEGGWRITFSAADDFRPTTPRERAFAPEVP